MTATTRAARTRRRGRIRAAITIVAIVVVVVAAGFLAYAASVMMAEEEPLAHAEEVVAVTETAEGVVLTPPDPGDEGLVFFAGARVDPAAYADKLSGVAASGITVVIARPTLNFAIFETRPLTTWEGLAPGVQRWAVGGHSLGGVKACMYAADHADELTGLVLFGSYCSVDLSASGLAVLSVAGENDGLSTPEKIADAAPLLPADAVFTTIPGASHAQFGDYGIQPGDGPQEADDTDVRDAITDAVTSFLG
ncbi:alpha/beta hydrolase [Protaetiibacter mangrovi]|uniref:Alpha/beta hydrolase n=1 Tax=Protaetiibacter mangrovi TaxID=2970926 RepID=A0ABT1ZHQ7_9MICO|nr:alpha/beta hydrolase [Protaetiibacter mangrovi]MCS0500252.1 alpha/beta hydrolase [Protaetiibacter mangrovi]